MIGAERAAGAVHGQALGVGARAYERALAGGERVQRLLDRPPGCRLRACVRVGAARGDVEGVPARGRQRRRQRAAEPGRRGRCRRRGGGGGGESPGAQDGGDCADLRLGRVVPGPVGGVDGEPVGASARQPGEERGGLRGAADPPAVAVEAVPRDASVVARGAPGEPDAQLRAVGEREAGRDGRREPVLPARRGASRSGTRGARRADSRPRGTTPRSSQEVSAARATAVPQAAESKSIVRFTSASTRLRPLGLTRRTPPGLLSVTTRSPRRDRGETTTSFAARTRARWALPRRAATTALTPFARRLLASRGRSSPA